jgi:hypothetical protein
MPALPDQLPSPRSAATRAGGTGQPGGGAPVNPLVQVAGGLGLAGVLLGFCIVIICCAGFDAALYFSPAVISLGVADLILTIVASHRSAAAQDSSTLASLFLAILCVGGGLLELAALVHWPILFNQPV